MAQTHSRQDTSYCYRLHFHNGEKTPHWQRNPAKGTLSVDFDLSLHADQKRLSFDAHEIAVAGGSKRVMGTLSEDATRALYEMLKMKFEGTGA